MAKKNKRANGTREKLSARRRKAYCAGYVRGYEDSANHGANGVLFHTITS